jgi:hypothetical protein
MHLDTDTVIDRCVSVLYIPLLQAGNGLVLESFMQYISTVLCCKCIAAEGLEKNRCWCAWCGKKIAWTVLQLLHWLFCATYVHLSKVFKSFLSVFTCSFSGYGNSYWFHCCLNFTIICLGGTKTTGKQTKVRQCTKKWKKKNESNVYHFSFLNSILSSFDMKSRHDLPKGAKCIARDVQLLVEKEELLRCVKEMNAHNVLLRL